MEIRVGVAEQSKALDEKGWGRGFESKTGSWLSPLPAVVRLTAISKASPSHTMSM